MRAGVSFGDWKTMARWQVQDFLLHHKAVTERTLKEIKSAKEPLSGAISAVVSRILGI